MVELVGTEKQVAWAEDIRKQFYESVERITKVLERHPDLFEGEDISKEEYFFIAEKLKKEESAKLWINYRFFKGIDFAEEMKFEKMEKALKEEGIYMEVDY